MELVWISILVIGVGVSIYLFKVRNNSTVNPMPAPEKPPVVIPKEEDPPIVDPVPDTQPQKFKPYFFKPVLFLEQTKYSKIIEITLLPGNVDQTDHIQAQLDRITDGTVLGPTVVKLPTERAWTEGNKDRIGIKKDNAILIFKGLKFFIVEGGNFYTKAPFTKYGGNISNNDYSHRRHIKFSRCEDFKFRKSRAEGSNQIEGVLLGKSAETTPSFWYQKYEKGYIQDPYTGDKWQNHTFVPTWYLDIRAKDLLTVGMIPEDALVVGSSAYYEMLKDLLPEGELVPAPHDDGSFGGASGYKSYWEFEHAYDFEYCKRFIAEELVAIGTWGDAVCIGVGNEDFEIRDVYAKYIGRQVAAIYDSRRGLFERIIAELCRRAGLDFEPYHDAGYADQLEVRFCKLHAIQVPFAALGLGTVNDINIHDNEYSGGSSIICGDSASRTRRKNWVFKDNVRTNVFGSPSADIKFHMTDNVLIEGNTIKLAKTQGQRIAQFADCTSVHVGLNTFTNAKEIVLHNSEISVEDSSIQLVEY